MRFSVLIRWSGLANILAALLLVAFWFLYALLLPFGKVAQSGVLPLAQDGDWLWVNLSGVLGALLGLLGLVGLYGRQASRVGVLGFGGFLMAFCGMAMMMCWLCWEALLWPIMAEQAPAVLSHQTGIYANSVVLGFLIGAGSLFSVGCVLLGIATIRASVLLRYGAWLIVVGAPLYGLGALFGPLQTIVRSIGLVVYAVGLAWLGYELLRQMGED